MNMLTEIRSSLYNFPKTNCVGSDKIDSSTRILDNVVCATKT